MKGKVQTVLGPIKGEELGITLVHEHLLVDATCAFMEPSDSREEHLAHEPVSLDNIGDIRFAPRSNIDNLCMFDEDKIINEVLLYKLAGGNTIVDVTPLTLHRDPDAMVRISKATGINVVMGLGYYIGRHSSDEVESRSEEELAQEFIHDITVGVGPNRVRAGIIGEIGCSYPLEDIERKVLRAAARAQYHTGAPLTIHPGYGEPSALEIIGVLKAAGADISRTIMCHVDISVREESTRYELAKTGCYLAYDHMGRLEYFSPHAWTLDLPDDLGRIDEIIKLIEWGYLNQILVSHDIASKETRSSYGGHGYEHILRRIVPLMKKRGITGDAINTILVENPKRVLTFL